MILGIISIILSVIALLINVVIVREQRKTIVAQQKLIELQREANNMATRNSRRALALLAKFKTENASGREENKGE